MYILFRADANEYIASGHMMRCIAVAKECIRLGHRVLFLTAEDKFTSILRINGLDFQILGTKWNDLRNEIPIICEYIKQTGGDILVVDTYQADSFYLETLQRQIPVVYFDDMGKEIYDISGVIHYGAHADDEGYLKRYREKKLFYKPKIISGMGYVPLRSEFSNNAGDIKREKKILITTGGTDPHNMAEKVIRSIWDEPLLESFDLDVILGKMSAYKDSIYELSKREPKISVYENVSDMDVHMKKAYMAVSAGGSTLYELCACGTPTVCFSFAENQTEGACEMSKRGMMIYAGYVQKDNNDIISNIIKGLCKFVDEKIWNIYSEKMKTTIDGMGCRRIVDFLQSNGGR